MRLAQKLKYARYWQKVGTWGNRKRVWGKRMRIVKRMGELDRGLTVRQRKGMQAWQRKNA